MSASISLPTTPEVLQVIGSEVRLRLTGQQTGNGLTMVEVVNAPGTGVPPHVHEHEDEVFHVLEGQLELTTESGTHVAGAGTIAFLPRGKMHGYRAIGDAPARALVTATPSGIEHMFRELAALPPGPPDLARVSEICGRHGVTFVA